MKKLKQTVAEFKRKYILKGIKRNRGNITQTAKELGIHRNTLILYINKLNLREDVKRIIVERRQNS